MEDTKGSFNSKQNPLSYTQQIYCDFFLNLRDLTTLGIWTMVYINRQSCKILNLANVEINNWQVQQLLRKKTQQHRQFGLQYKQQHLNDYRCKSSPILMTKIMTTPLIIV